MKKQTIVENETTQGVDESYLFKYAFCGTDADFALTLEKLATLAEEEQWTLSTERKNDVLRKYIIGTFKQSYEQNKILYTDDGKYACFNTGLLTDNGNDILGFFRKNTRQDAQKWILRSFVDKTDRVFMNTFSRVPDLVTYTDDYEKFYFNPNYELIINSDHILDDNWDRIHDVVHLPKTVVKAMIEGSIAEAKRKIKRNIRLVVPQFYNGEIMYLVPIVFPIDDDKHITMALAVELTVHNQYRANTIFTKEMAYEKARLLMKPESNWLLK